MALLTVVLPAQIGGIESQLNLQTPCGHVSCEVRVLYQLDTQEKSGIIDFFRVDIDIMNKK